MCGNACNARSATLPGAHPPSAGSGRSCYKKLPGGDQPITNKAGPVASGVHFAAGIFEAADGIRPASAQASSGAFPARRPPIA